MEYDKKREERNILDGFLKRLQLEPSKVRETEKPDFILTFSRDNKTVNVGCEVTKYYSDTNSRGSYQARFESKWKMFSDTLVEKIDKVKGVSHVSTGTIHFIDSRFDILDNINIDDLSTEVANVVYSEKQKFRVTIFDKKEYPLLNEYVSTIFLPVSDNKSKYWFYGHKKTGNVEESGSKIIAIIEQKNQISTNYKWNEVDEIWLLIYSGTELLNQLVDDYGDLKIREKYGNLKFKKIYIWNKYFEEIDEIYPSYVKIFSIDNEVQFRNHYSPLVREFVIDGGK